MASGKEFDAVIIQFEWFAKGDGIAGCFGAVACAQNIGVGWRTQDPFVTCKMIGMRMRNEGQRLHPRWIQPEICFGQVDPSIPGLDRNFTASRLR